MKYEKIQDVEQEVCEFPECDYNVIGGLFYRLCNVTKIPHPKILQEFSVFMDGKEMK